MLQFVAIGIGYVVLTILGLLLLFVVSVRLIEELGKHSFLKLEDYNEKIPSEVQDLRNRVIIIKRKLNKEIKKK